MKTTTKTNEVIADNTVAQPNQLTASTAPEYNGIEMFKSDYSTGPLKVNMDSNEVKAFLKDNDPSIYFREGKIPTYYKQLGDLLDDDREETQVLKETLPQYAGILLFKHRQQSLYTLVVPKIFGEFELDDQGEIRDANVKVHTVAIAFGASGLPAAYEKGAFKKALLKAGPHFESNKSRNVRG